MLTINTKICTDYFAPLIGWNEETHRCEKISNIICFRRGSPRPKDYQKHITKINLGMTSYYDITKKPYCDYINAWLHCFKNPKDFIKDNKPKILLSESDFLDDNTVLCNKNPNKKHKYDFFYFTMGGIEGKAFKGVVVFADCLSILCDKYKLKGIVIQYVGKNPLYLKDKRLQIYNRLIHSGQIVLKKRQSPNVVADIMANCKFGFFPNKLDCSPLLITECLVRNKPILMNDKIVGGWKYIHNKTGRFFNTDNLQESIDFATHSILNDSFQPRKIYLKEYGFKKSAVRLAKFLQAHYNGFYKYSMVAFDRYKPLIEKYRKC